MPELKRRRPIDRETTPDSPDLDAHADMLVGMLRTATQIARLPPDDRARTLPLVHALVRMMTTSEAPPTSPESDLI